MPVLAVALLLVIDPQPVSIDPAPPAGRVYALTEHHSGRIEIFTHHPAGEPPVLMQRERNAHGHWSAPAPVSFSHPSGDADAYFQPGTDRLVFMSQRGDTADNWDIWEVNWTVDGWASPTPISAINAPGADIYPTVAADGRIAFATTREGTSGDRQIWIAQPGIDGDYSVAAAPGDLNRDPRVSNPLLFPDGRRMIVFEIRDDGFGGPDLALSCLTESGWSTPVNLGETINTDTPEYAPGLNADGTVLNFIRGDVLHQVPVAALGPSADCDGTVPLQEDEAG